MKNLVLSFLFVGIFLSGTSQGALKTKLLEVYSVETTAEILSNCQKKNFYTNFIFNSYKISKIDTDKKKSSIVVLKSLNYKNLDGTHTILTPEQIVEKINNGSFNIMRVKLSRNLKTSTSYILGDTSLMITLYSQEYINKLTKKQKC